jgi:diacylglycerol kinase (ATP)
MQVLILVNPRAGNNEGERWLKALRDHFGGEGGELRAVVLPTQVGGVLQQLHAKAESADRVIVVGGDGTASAVIHGLSAMRRSIPVGVIPLGTGNDLARSLDLHRGRPWTLQEAIRYVRSSRTQWVDIWSLNGRLTFNNYLSVGLDAQIVRDFSRIRQWIQARPLWGRRGLYFTVYFLVGLRHVRGRVPPGSRLVWTDAEGVERFLYLRAPRVLALSNTPYYAAGALMDSGGAVGDRLLEATIFPDLRSYVELLAMRVPTFARWGIQKRWRRIRARQLEIRLSEPTSVQADGEDVTGQMGGARVLYIGPLGQIPILLKDE